VSKLEQQHQGRGAESPPALRPDVAAARTHSDRAVETMAEIMQDSEAPAGDRLRAAKELLERAWGRSASETEASDELDYDDIISSLGPRDAATPATL